MSGEWLVVSRESEHQVGEIIAASMGGIDVVVCRTGEGFSVLERRCLHAGADLAEGVLVGNELICPLHGWRYRAADGGHVQSACNQLATYPVRVEQDGTVVACTTPNVKETL